MKKNKTSKTDLRAQAEAQLSRRRESPVTESEGLRLIHELEVHQIELELQNEELLQSRAEVEAAYRQYTDLYDFAPVGYLTLTREGLIPQANLAATRLLGVERSQLIQRRLGVFVVRESHPTFNAFFEKLLVGQGQETCELIFEKQEAPPLWARLEATCFEGGPAGRVALIDLSQRKQIEAELRQAQERLTALNAELQAALSREQQLAQIDGLTGINNRRHLFELAEYEFEVSTRYQQPLAVIMFDLDYFKQVNDTFGHAVGDEILQRVTQVAGAELRSADVFGRYGGEEFVILLPMTSALQAQTLAERILEKVAAIRVSTETGAAAVTISLGISERLPGAPTESAEILIRRADQAMYAAKQAGRNRSEIGK